MATDVPTVGLSNEVRITVLGLGTAGLLGESGYAGIRTACDAGYRHLDTATAYRNDLWNVGLTPDEIARIDALAVATD